MTSEKHKQLENIRTEYTKVVNLFIELFWENTPSKYDLKKDVLNQVTKEQTWLSQRMIQCCAREAASMISSAKEKAKELNEEVVKPVHKGNRMVLSSQIALLQAPEKASEFDNWLHLQSIGNKISIDIPIKKHKHFNDLAELGKLSSTIIILKNDIQFSFKIQTGAKLEPDRCIGIDTGINTLATLSTGQKFGPELKQMIAKLKRCKRGSKRAKRTRASIKCYISKVAKEVVPMASLVVVENLKGLSKNTKKTKRLHKPFRYFIGNWNYSFWLRKVELACERNRVSFRSVPAYNTSRRCSVCGHTDKRNRLSQEIFLCRKCGHSANADINAAKNILDRFLTGQYGAGCKAATI